MAPSTPYTPQPEDPQNPTSPQSENTLPDPSQPENQHPDPLPIPAQSESPLPEPPQSESPLPEPAPLPSTPKRGKALLIAISLVAIAVIAAILIFLLPLILAKAPDKAVIRIPAGATKEIVLDSIAKYLGPDYASKVMRVASLRGSDFSSRHGAYLIEQGASPFRAERRLTKGAQHPLTITINGFRTLPLLTQRISRRLDFSADSLSKVLADTTILSKYNLTPAQAIALFIDDSYELYWSASPEHLIAKIGANYNSIWNKQRRDKAAKLGLSPAQIMTIASIVDEETNKLDEKGKVGRLYINRLRIGMPLQADPTIRYALNDFSIRRVKGNHLKVESPYNTYTNRGLPPGPIRTTSVATIDEILNSQPSDHLYMCAKEDFSGYHNFASSYADHLANARRYQKALDLRGIH